MTSATVTPREQQAIDTFLRSAEEAAEIQLPARERAYFDDRGKLVAVVAVDSYYTRLK